MVTVKTSPTKLSDIVEWMVRDDFCLESVTIKTPSGVAVSVADANGLILKEQSAGVYEPIAATDEANADSILWEMGPLELASNASITKQTILKRGSALVKFDNITVDYVGASLTIATVKTALAALDILDFPTPDQTSTQTT